MPGHPLDTGRVDADPQASGPVLTMPAAPPAFHLMAKPTGATCNLDCEYCFFLSKEMLYPGSRFRMARDLQETYIRQLLEAHARAPEVVVAWQGGEPTMMGLDFFRRSIELQRRYARPGQRILNTMQTNGTLLTDEWGVFLKENDFLVGISIDGPPEMHDAYRVDKGGKPTSARVLRGLDVLKRHGVDWNVLTTIHAVNGDHGREVYRYLRDGLGATFVQYIPIIERATPETLAIADAGWGSHVHGRPLYLQDGSLVTHRSVGPEQYGRFMIDVFEEWVRRDIGTVYVQMFDTALANWYANPARCACTPRPAVSKWFWNTTVTCIPATITSNPGTCWATSRKSGCWTWWRCRSSGSSGWTSGTPSPRSAGIVMCGSRATVAVRRTVSRRPRTGSAVSITCVRVISRSSGISENPCRPW